MRAEKSYSKSKTDGASARLEEIETPSYTIALNDVITFTNMYDEDGKNWTCSLDASALELTVYETPSMGGPISVEKFFQIKGLIKGEHTVDFRLYEGDEIVDSFSSVIIVE